MSMTLGAEIRLPVSFDAAVTRVREALQAQGFGILTQIDMQSAFREKLGKEFRPYTILGACNPPLAYAALDADPAVGLLLPCNVTVEAAAPAESVVRLSDPHLLLGTGALGENTALRQVADDARARLERVAVALGGGPAA